MPEMVDPYSLDDTEEARIVPKRTPMCGSRVETPKTTMADIKFTKPTEFETGVDLVLGEIRSMLIAKNAGYGNSALDPIRVFSKATPMEQLLVRIDDKLSRLSRGKGELHEDTVNDLIGYLVILKIAERNASAT